MKLLSCFLIITLVFCSCGLFTPRDAETPEQSVVSDPFNFGSLRWGTDQFSKVSYQELFDASLNYVDVNGTVFKYSEFLNHLSTMQSKLTIKTAIWTVDGSSSDIQEGDSLWILYRIYQVDAYDAKSIEYTFTAPVTMRVWRGATRTEWTIIEFTDKYSGYSVFHPLFDLGN